MNSSSIIMSISKVSDPRINRTKKYTLAEVLFLVISACVSGCNTWSSMATFGEEKIDWLRKHLPYLNGVPSEDTIVRVMRIIDPACLQKALEECTRNIIDSPSKVINIDGKTNCGSYDTAEDKSALHVVSAFCEENKVALCNESVPNKGSELTAMRNIIDMLNLKDATVTIDALGCQSDILQSIVDKGGDYVVALKNNHKKLYKGVKDVFEAMETGKLKVKISEHTSSESGHGRSEKRACRTINIDKCKEYFTDLQKWPSIKTIVEIESTRTINDKTTTCKRYYVSSSELAAQEALVTIRKHWSIENKLHWMLDIAFREDESRVRKGNAPQNLASAVKVAFNVLSKKKSQLKMSMPKMMQKALLNDKFRENMLFGGEI